MTETVDALGAWHCRLDDDHVLWLGLDCPNSSANTLGRSVLTELKTILTEQVVGNTDVRAVVFYSCKSSGFIAGADVRAFEGLSDVDQALAYVRQGQELMTAIETLPVPTVALIDGFCLGGGLEFALACRYRIASSDLKTKLALPEVMLGIQPAWGGTVRLPERVGSLAALPLMLSGKSLTAQKARKLGLVNEVVSKRYLFASAKKWALKGGKIKPLPWWDAILNAAWLRPHCARFLRYQLKQKIRPEHYPAPFQVLAAWQQQGSRDEKFQAEVSGIRSLATSDTAKNLVRVFLLQERLKAQAKTADNGQAWKAQHVHVIGAGTMGGDIAAWCLSRGLMVSVEDPNPQALANTFAKAQRSLQRKYKRKKHLVTAGLDRLRADPKGEQVRQADVIIEAVIESLEVKQALFQRLEKQTKPQAILATNTSSIPLADIASSMQAPERLVGIHFFNPVAKMRLIEVVVCDATSTTVVQHAKQFAKQLDRIAVEVRSKPGFLINRILLPYLMESVQLLEEGVDPAVIDEAACAFGMPMGPITLADRVGLDICLHVAKTLCAAYGGEVPAILIHKVEQGHLGVKSGKGFYQHGTQTFKLPWSKRTPDINSELKTELQNRLIMRILNEAMACLDEKVVADADTLDIGMIFGTGFAPFRGGPMQYAHSLGTQALTILEHLQQRYGERFKPHSGWQNFFVDDKETGHEPNQEE